VRFPIAVDNLVLNNPLIRRYHCSLFRRSYLWVYLTIYASVVLLLLFINVSARELAGTPAVTEKFFRGLYHQFLMIEVMLLWVWSALNSRSALREEIANKTYDFFRLLPLSALQKAIGILAGKNLLSLLFAAVTLGPMTLFGLLGGVDVSLQVQILLVLFSIALCTNSVALLLSSTSPKRQGKPSTAVLILLSILVVPFFLGPLFTSIHTITQSQDAATYSVTFYTVEVPLLLLIVSVALYFGIWSVFGILRKFTFEGAPLFSRSGAVLFLLGYELITLGLFLPHFLEGAVPVYFLWLVVSLLAVVLIPVGSINDCACYLEGCGLRPARSNSSAKDMALPLLRRSNLTLGAVLFAVWVAFFVVTGLVSAVPLRQFAADTAVLTSFFVLLLLILELYVLYEPLHGKIGLLLAFVVLLYMFLPLILAVTLDVASLRFYSPFAFLADFATVSRSERAKVWVSVLAVNMGLCVIPALAIRRRYAQLLALRRAM
jgi:hypothetical protein